MSLRIVLVVALALVAGLSAGAGIDTPRAQGPGGGLSELIPLGVMIVAGLTATFFCAPIWPLEGGAGTAAAAALPCVNHSIPPGRATPPVHSER
jgi:hypothetical protein